MDLEDCFSRLCLSSLFVFNEGEGEGETGTHHPLPLEDKERHMYDIRTEMENALLLVDNILCPSCNNIDANAADVRQLLEVSGIIDTLKKYRGISLDMHLHDLGRGADMLIEQWCKGKSEY